MTYSIEIHKHRFAAWAAGRAASASSLCRFEVEVAKNIIETVGLNIIAQSIDYLPNPEDFDVKHREWREAVIKSAESYQLRFTHGVAAKLINCYLKSVFVCGGSENHEKVKAIHPPIDSLLLNELYRINLGGKKHEWNKAKNAKWSKFNNSEYEEVILAIKGVIPVGEGLWTIEQYWQGYQ